MKNYLSTVFRAIFTIALFVLAGQLLNLTLEQDQRFGMFDWLESPNPGPFYHLFGTALAILGWWLTRRFVTGNRENIVEEVLYWSITVAWLINCLLIAIFFFDRPSAPISSLYEVNVFDLRTQLNQSKPIKHDLIVNSWRREGTETLRTQHYYEAEKLLKAGKAKIAIGDDWLGRTRVLRAEPIGLNDAKLSK